MARGKSRFIIGLFVTVGFMLGVAAIVWLGASNYFEAGDFYITYFDESVQGLQVDSRVKYRGVDVGKVQRIGVASDHKLVEVVIKIDMAGDVEKYTLTQLRSAGITGIVFIELDQRTPGDSVLLPPQEIRHDYPAIPSKTSQGLQMLKSADRIIDKIEQVDLQGISDQVKQTSRAMETFLAGPAMTHILKNIESTTVTLDRSLRRIDLLLENKAVEEVFAEARQGVGEARQGIAETRQGIAEIRQLVADLRKEVATLKTEDIAKKVNILLDGIDRRTRGMSLDLEETTDDVREAVASLRQLIERLRENPSDLLFSRPQNDDPKRKAR